MGKSTGSQEQYTTKLMADDVASLLDQLHIEKAYIVGTSMGGMIAQELAINYPEKIDRLVLASTFAKHPEMITILRKKLSQLITTDAKTLDFTAQSFTFRPLYTLLLKQVFSESFLQLHGSMITHMLDRFHSQDTYVETFLKQLHAIKHHDTTDRLDKITADTLVLTCDNDRLVPEECSEFLMQHIPRATHQIVEGATHGFHIESAESFNKIIHSFMKKSNEKNNIISIKNL
jgi:pimeloyl-ACP methyl ester carboxylesterase